MNTRFFSPNLRVILDDIYQLSTTYPDLIAGGLLVLGVIVVVLRYPLPAHLMNDPAELAELEENRCRMHAA